MKLLELLVEELPKRGGWPEEAKNTIEMHNNESIFFDGVYTDNFHLPPCSDGWRADSFVYSDTDDGFWSNEVTREQYEAALAASQQPLWDGEGLPPVGMKVEWRSQEYGWIGGTVAAYDEKYAQVAIIRHNDGYTGCHRHEIRTEAERTNKEISISTICSVIGVRENNIVVQQTYDAIAAGKIPGIELTRSE